jgi:hypothetical protein
VIGAVPLFPRAFPALRRGVVLAAMLAALVAGSCGYDTGLRVAERHQSIGVEVFGNDSLERDLERPLHDQITRAIRDLTDARLESPSRAEVVVRGTVKTFQRRGGVRSENNVLLETGIYIDVEAGLYDRRTGRALGAPKRAGPAIGFVLDDPDNEARAKERLFRLIADQLVLDLFAPVD